MAKGKAKKVNPRRKPVSEADLNRAKATASDQAVKLAIAIFLTVLKDRFDFDNDQICEAWEAMNKLSEEIKEHRISAWDLVNVLREEYGISVSR
ncbi:MAG: hypothetical protein IKM73_00305 [Acidaminococcaceae bacterium]|nr:hypothetical protein [Acidaminococcaceae bacterium]